MDALQYNMGNPHVNKCIIIIITHTALQKNIYFVSSNILTKINDIILPIEFDHFTDYSTIRASQGMAGIV